MSLRGAIEARRRMVPTFPQHGNQWEPLKAAPAKEVPTVPTVPTDSGKNQFEAHNIPGTLRAKRVEGVARPYIFVGTVGTWEPTPIEPSNSKASGDSGMVPTWKTNVGTVGTNQPLSPSTEPVPPTYHADPEEPSTPEAIRALILAGWVWHRGEWFRPGTWKPSPCPTAHPEPLNSKEPTP